VNTGIAIISWQIFSSRLSKIQGLFYRPFPSVGPHRKNSTGVKSGDLVGHMSFEIIQSPQKRLSISFILAFM
jgi:hypothetical protein